MALWTRPPAHSDLTIANNAVNANLTYIQGDAVADGNDGLLDVNIKEVGDDDITDNGDGRLEVNVEEISDTAVANTVAGHIDVNVTYWEDDAVPATDDGYPAVNVDEWDNTDVATATAGYPEVNVTYWEDSAITDADEDPDVDVVSIGNNVITSASINDGGITDADVADDVKVDTNTIEAGDATDAINTEVDNGIITYNLDHWMHTATSDAANLPEVVDNTVLANILTKTDGDTSDYDFTTDSLEAIRDKETDIETDTNELQTNQNWNVWDDGTRTLTAIDEDSTTLDLDGSYVGGVTTFDEDSTTIDIDGTTIGTVTNLTNEPNVWDDGTRTLTAIDEDNTTLDLDATTVGDVTAGVDLTSTTETQIDNIETKIKRLP